MFLKKININKKHFKILELSIFLGLIFTISFTLMGFNYECEKISNSVLRLHILANSDSKEDQDLKLAVRDRIINKSADIFNSTDNLNCAENIISEKFMDIESIAKEVITENGYNYDVKVQLVNMYFNNRQYEKVTLPAGNYDAVRIIIGEGKGKNWWCVMFPPMCLPAAEESKELSQVLNDKQLDIVENSEKYEIKFKLLELLNHHQY